MRGTTSLFPAPQKSCVAPPCGCDPIVKVVIAEHLVTALAAFHTADRRSLPRVTDVPKIVPFYSLL